MVASSHCDVFHVRAPQVGVGSERPSVSVSAARGRHEEMRPGAPRRAARARKRPQSSAALKFSGLPDDTLYMPASTAQLPRNSRQLVFTSSQAAATSASRWRRSAAGPTRGTSDCYRTPGGQRRFSRDQLDAFVTSMAPRGRPRLDDRPGRGPARRRVAALSSPAGRTSRAAGGRTRIPAAGRSSRQSSRKPRRSPRRRRSPRGPAVDGDVERLARAVVDGQAVVRRDHQRPRRHRVGRDEGHHEALHPPRHHGPAVGEVVAGGAGRGRHDEPVAADAAGVLAVERVGELGDPLADLAVDATSLIAVAARRRARARSRAGAAARSRRRARGRCRPRPPRARPWRGSRSRRS